MPNYLSVWWRKGPSFGLIALVVVLPVVVGGRVEWVVQLLEVGALETGHCVRHRLICVVVQDVSVDADGKVLHAL